jgi:hypothetical protein
MTRETVLLLDYMDICLQLMGLSGIRSFTERRWFALLNLHMPYYEDSHVLNEYLHHWRDSQDDCWRSTFDCLPAGMKAMTFAGRHLPITRRQAEQATCARMTQMAGYRCNRTAYWYKNRCDLRMTTFYRDAEKHSQMAVLVDSMV